MPITICVVVLGSLGLAAAVYPALGQGKTTAPPPPAAMKAAEDLSAAFEYVAESVKASVVN
ncbi:MAG: hypothetical protein GX616_16065, partial [Planctomycetes bacterium]|nr:hypothetical protein [Planctomycetota bacterium]